jgi:hypothetical protein
MVVLLGLPWAVRADQTAPQVTSYFQVRLTDPIDQEAYLSLRRLKLMVQGGLGADAGYYFQALYKSNNQSSTDGQPYVQELSAWRRWGRSRVTLGQFKPPFGWERFTGDYELALIDRSPVTDHLVPDGSLGKSFARDRGLQVDGKTGAMGWAVGVFDGAGANNDPHGFGPLLVARTAVNHKLAGGKDAPAVHAEAALSWRQARDLDFTGQLPGTKSLGYGHFSGHDWRGDLAAGVRGSRWELRGEYLRAAFRPSSAGTAEVTADGYYLQGNYRLGRRLEGALKYDDFSTHHGYRLEQTTVGLNLDLPHKGERLQLNYLLRDVSSGYTASDALVCQYQRFF